MPNKSQRATPDWRQRLEQLKTEKKPTSAVVAAPAAKMAKPSKPGKTAKAVKVKKDKGPIFDPEQVKLPVDLKVEDLPAPDPALDVEFGRHWNRYVEKQRAEFAKLNGHPPPRKKRHKRVLSPERLARFTEQLQARTPDVPAPPAGHLRLLDYVALKHWPVAGQDTMLLLGRQLMTMAAKQGVVCPLTTCETYKRVRCYPLTLLEAFFTQCPPPVELEEKRTKGLKKRESKRRGWERWRRIVRWGFEQWWRAQPHSQ